jgi:hypothetical protein
VSLGDCVAVGYYQIDADEDELLIVISESGGVRGQAGSIPLSNTTARALYDRVAEHRGFIVYQRHL